jgi:hypothetical protein
MAKTHEARSDLLGETLVREETVKVCGICALRISAQISAKGCRLNDCQVCTKCFAGRTTEGIKSEWKCIHGDKITNLCIFPPSKKGKQLTKMLYETRKSSLFEGVVMPDSMRQIIDLVLHPFKEIVTDRNVISNMSVEELRMFRVVWANRLTLITIHRMCAQMEAQLWEVWKDVDKSWQTVWGEDEEGESDSGTYFGD